MLSVAAVFCIASPLSLLMYDVLYICTYLLERCLCRLRGLSDYEGLCSMAHTVSYRLFYCYQVVSAEYMDGYSSVVSMQIGSQLEAKRWRALDRCQALHCLFSIQLF